MVRSKLGAVRRAQFLASVLTLSAVSLSAQVVEKGRTYADLVATHPCNSGSSGRLARITDAQSSSSIGGGGGSTQVWAVCNGVDTWTLTAIGGGGGVSGLSTADGGTALSDNAIVRGDGTTGVQGSTVTVADSTGNLQWEGTTADAFEGNFTFADPTADWTWAWGAAGDLVGAGSLSVDNLKIDGNTISSTDTNGNFIVAPNGTGSLQLPAGSAALPGLVFTGSTTSGLANINGSVVIVDATAQLGAFDDFDLAMRMPNGGQVSFTSNSTPATTIGDVGFGRRAAGVGRLTDGSTGVRGLFGGGADVASASALPVPTGRVFHVTGTTNIDSITSTNFQSGVCITLIFDDILTVADGSNLKLTAALVTTADDTLSLCYDGTNWYEASRSIN